MADAQHVFVVGAKGLGNYGGFETFVSKLTEYHQDDSRLCYHVACKATGVGVMDERMLPGVTRLSDTEFLYRNARCFKIRIPRFLGRAQAIFYDVMALRKCLQIIRYEKIPHPVVYILACRIGPALGYYARKLRSLGGRVLLNPDGHEWLRGKWSAPVKRYWKLSEALMVRSSDLVICDSKNIEDYIQQTYAGKGLGKKDPQTAYIAYGAETRTSLLRDDDPAFTGWLREKGLRSGEYYLAVGRFVPENNYETMIREFMQSRTKKDFAIITTPDEALLNRLEEKLHFRSDPRIRFVGTVYDQELLMKIRENAWGYFHGHEVGGTNPSLLEAMSSTKLNLLLDVSFNREVGQDAALYWNKEPGNLAQLIHRCDSLSREERSCCGARAADRIREAYSWKDICERFAQVFLGGKEG